MDSSVDRFVEFAQPSTHGIGQALKLETIDSRLRRFDTLEMLDAIAQLAFRFRLPDFDQQEKAVGELDPTLALQYQDLRRRADWPVALISPQALDLLAVRALAAAGPISRGHRPLAEVAKTALRLCLSLQDHVGPDTNDPAATEAEVTRISAYYLESDYKVWLEVSLLVLASHSNRAVDHDWVDLEAIVRAASGLSIEVFMAIGFLAAEQSGRSQGNHRWPPVIEGRLKISTDDLKGWARAWSVSLREACERAQAELQDGGWAIGAVTASPLLAVDDGSFLWLRPATSYRGLTPFGLRSMLERFASEAGVDRSLVATYWGRVSEDAGKALVESITSSERLVLNEDQLRDKVGRKKPVCDAAVVEDSEAVALDFTVSSLSVKSLTVASADELWSDYSRVIERKLEQLDNTLAGLRDEYALPELRVAPVIVSFGLLPWTGYVESHIESLVAAKDRQVLGGDDCERVTILSGADLLWLCSAVSRGEAGMYELITQWNESSLAASSLRTFLIEMGIGAPDIRRIPDLLERVVFEQSETSMETE